MIAHAGSQLIARAVQNLRREGLFDAADEGANVLQAIAAGHANPTRGRPEALAHLDAALKKLLRVDETGHRARIRFDLEPSWSTDLSLHEVVSLKDVEIGVLWELRLLEDSRERRAVVLESSAVGDQSAARRAAARMLSAVMATSIERGFGVSLSDRRPPALFFKSGLEMFGLKGAQNLPDALGVMFFETPPPTVFLTPPRFVGSVRTPVSLLVEHLESSFKIAGELGVEETIQTAYELFSSSRFENSSRSRFLLLVMAIEAMTEPQERPADESAFIESTLKELARSSLSTEKKGMLRNAIGNLKKQSIGSAARNQIAREVSQEKGSEFRHVYALRSRLVHGGEPVPAGELNEAVNNLEPTVKAMLLRRLTRRSPD